MSEPKRLPVVEQPEDALSAESLVERLPEIDQAILDHFLEIDNQGKFVNPPKTPDELHLFIQVAFGVTIPRKAVVPGHKAPFDLISDLFFEKHTKNALAFANRTGGKSLWIETPILTVNRGWTTVGKLTLEDSVFADDGAPAKITELTPIVTDRDCFEIKFTSGETIIADADHIWFTNRAKQAPREWTTKEMWEVQENPPNIGYKKLFTIHGAGALRYPTLPLPVDPYVLGLWLGDGCAYNSNIEIWEEESRQRVLSLWDGASVTNREKAAGQQVNLPGLWLALRDFVGLEETFLTRKGKPITGGRGRLKKRIPAQYLTADVDSRVALLRGLMDADGHFQKNRTRCELSTVDEALAHDLVTLLRSLSFIPQLSARDSGKYTTGDKVVVTGNAVYRVSFGIDRKSINPFLLSRKAAAVRASNRRYVHRIERITPVECVPVRCIAIDHPSHLYLVGQSLIPTHNTFNVAILNLLDCLFKPGCEIASAGAVQTQAFQAFKYFTDFINSQWFKDFNAKYQAVVGRPFLEKDNKSEASFDNGSSQSIITASEKGLRSPHPNKARIDEIDLLEWSILQTGLSMAQSKGRPGRPGYIRGQNVFTSTRQLENGSMQKLLDQAEQKGIKVYEWNIWDVLETCKRQCVNDPVHGSCPIYTFCQGRAHESEGFYPIDDFIDKARLLDRDTFETEWENKRPSRAKLVYSTYDSTRHLMTSEKLFKMTGYKVPQPTWQIVSGMDFGASEGHPFVYLKLCQLPTGAWLVFWEYVSNPRTLRDHAMEIKRSPYWRASEPIFSDWDAQDRRELRELGIKVQMANKDLDMGINHLRTLLNGTPPLEEPLLYFWGSEGGQFKPVTMTIRQFSSYSYPTGPDGKPISAKPIKVNDDTCFTDATEVLTSAGWVSLRDVTTDDTVLAVDESGNGLWEKPRRVIHKEYSGKMYSIRHPHLEFDATEDHNHAVISQYDHKRRKVVSLKKATVAELPSESYWRNVATILPGTGLFEQGEDEAWFAGFWLAEGCFDSKRPTYLIVDQAKEHNIASCRQRLLRLGWQWSETVVKRVGRKNLVRFVVSSQGVRAALWRKYLGSGAQNKKLPIPWVLQMNNVEREALFAGYMAGDGSVVSSSWHFDSISKQLIDGIQFLANSIGVYSRIVSYPCMDGGSSEILGRVVDTHKSYRGHVLRRGETTHVRKTLFQSYDAQNLMVHCVTTSTGMFFARNNGKTFVAGNCDALRYALYTWKFKHGNKYRTYSVEGI